MTDSRAVLLAKRRQLVDALLAIYGSPKRVIIDMALAEALERAWAEYDNAVRVSGRGST